MTPGSLQDLKHKCTDPIEVSRSGNFYRARFRGKAQSAMGATAHQARERLLRMGKTTSLQQATFARLEEEIVSATRSNHP